MNRFLPVLVSAALAAAPACQQPSGPEVPPSVLFGDPAAVRGGRLTVGVLLPRADPDRLVDLVPNAEVDEFLARLDRIQEAPPEPEPRPFSTWANLGDLRRAEAALEKAFGIDVDVHEVLADECGPLPVVFAPIRRYARGELELLQRYVAGGGIVWLDVADQATLLRLCPGAKITAEDFGALADRDVIVRALGAQRNVPVVAVARVDGRAVAFGSASQTLFGRGDAIEHRNVAVALIAHAVRHSAKIRWLDGDPPGIADAYRDGDDVRFTPVLPRLPGVSARTTARVVDLDGAVVWQRELVDAAEQRFAFPDPALDPVTHRIELDWRAGDLELRFARSIEALCGTVDRRVRASATAFAGGDYAVRVLFANSRTGAAVAGRSVQVALRRGDYVLAQARGDSDRHGTLDLRLAVADSTEPGPATLLVGDTRFDIAIERAHRVDVVTDRTLYREDETIHARALVRRHPSGVPASGEPVQLELVDARGRTIARENATTSAFGVASVRFELVEPPLGELGVRVRAGGAEAKTSLTVQAFDLPRMRLDVEPPSLRCRPGEAQPLQVTVRYVDGAPVVGAEVALYDDVTGAVHGETDAAGGFAARVAAGDRAGRRDVRLEVRDADGRRAVRGVSVEVVDASVEVVVRALREPIAGRICAFEIAAATRGAMPLPRTARVRLGGGAIAEREVPLGADGKGVIEAVVPEGDRLEVLASAEGASPFAAAWPVTPARPTAPIAVPDRLVARVGETLSIELLGPSGPVFLDVSRDGVLLRTLAATIGDDAMKLGLALDDALAGLLELRCFGFAGEAVVGSTRSLWVARRPGLSVAAVPHAGSYRPGETATIDVRVVGSDGAPRAAALGYWAVDTALLELSPWHRGRETWFDALPQKPVAGLESLAWRRVDLDGPVDYGSAALVLGASRAIDAIELGIAHRELDDRRAAAHRIARSRTEALVTTLRDRVAAVLGAMPLDELRRTGSFRQTVLWLHARGGLRADALRDPWGGPFAYSEGWQGVCWISAGPDARFGTDDDVRVGLDAGEMRRSLPVRTRAFLAFVGDKLRNSSPEEEEIVLFDEETLEVLESAFDSNQWNSAIGFGGGAGGKFGGAGPGRTQAHAIGAASVPVRRDFRPTLCFVPELVVGADGMARLDVPLADSITTWRMRLVASDLTGATGVATTDLRVTQPFHLEPWVSARLTVGDELDLPVSVRNAQDGAVRATLSLAVGAALEVVGRARVELDIGPGGTAAHSFRIRAVSPGDAELRLDGLAGAHGDAVVRSVRVAPFARAVDETKSAVVHGERAWRTTWHVPDDGAGPARLRLLVTPNALAEAFAGFEALVCEPHGCFEQTSSTVYPMVMALAWLDANGEARPELRARAQEYVGKGYRRLLGFEVSGQSGGFEWYGRDPAHTLLTAYGLLEFQDLARVHPIDPALVPRIVKFLQGRQADDGSFAAERFGTLAEIAGDRFRTTAYVAWALGAAGAPSAKALWWLAQHASDALDGYAAGIAALAFLASDAADPRGKRFLDVLPDLAVRDGELVSWPAGAPTGIGARGRSAGVEATALAIEALARAGKAPDLVDGGIRWLAAVRRGNGGFGTTQATVLALRALLAADAGGSTGNATLRVRLDGHEVARRELTADVMAPIEVVLAEPLAPGSHEVEVALDGRRSVRASLCATTWRPWAAAPPASGPLALTVTWPDDELRSGLDAFAVVRLVNNGKLPARNVTAEIGLPPGCDPDAARVDGDDFARAEHGDGRVVIYLDGLAAGQSVRYRIPFVPRHGLDVRTAPSRAYEYYVPEEAVVVAPQRVRAQ